jgi:hypothetical protein
VLIQIGDAIFMLEAIKTLNRCAENQRSSRAKCATTSRSFSRRLIVKRTDAKPQRKHRFLLRMKHAAASH